MLSAVREVWGLFVEDGSFTVAIGACLLIAYFVFPEVGLPLVLRGPALFVVLALALLENVRRSAGRS